VRGARRRICKERFVVAFCIGSVHLKGWWFGFAQLVMVWYSNLFVRGVACRIFRELVVRAWGVSHYRGVHVQARLLEGGLSVVLACGTDAGGSSVSRQVRVSQLADSCHR
jgi:hypothetical protein